MITIIVDKIKILDQISYDSFINSLDFNTLSCQCGHSACLTKHAYYVRSIKTCSPQPVVLTILRVKCSHCGRTHAVIPHLIVPYSQITIQDHIEIISNHISGNSQAALMNEKCLIDENNIRCILHNYYKYWHQRLRAFNISISESLQDLISKCFKHLKRQFMQIKCTCNKLLRPTHIT